MIGCLLLFVVCCLAFYLPLLAIDMVVEHKKTCLMLCMFEILVLIVMFRMPLLGGDVIYIIIATLSAIAVWDIKFKRLLKDTNKSIQLWERLNR